MQKHLLSILILIGFAACNTSYSDLTKDEQLIVNRIRQVRELRGEVATYWPQFDAPQYDVPLLYYTDSVCYALNPEQQFRDEFKAQLIYRDTECEIYKTALPDSIPFHMETQITFDDSTRYNSHMPYLYCSSPQITALTITDVTTDSLWLPMVLHEYAHGFQYRQQGVAESFAREMADIPENNLSRLHTRLDWFDRAIKAENGMLLAALDTDIPAVRDSCIRNFQTLRATRKQKMSAELGDSAVRAEEIYELMEGMARYIEAHVGFRLGSYTEADKWLYDTDCSGYFFATGYNLVQLLDKCGVDKSRLFTPEMFPLETFLTK